MSHGFGLLAERVNGDNRRFIDNDAAAGEGDCAVLNTWSADTPAVNRFLLEAARRLGEGVRRIYGKRVYEDGTIRPVALSVTAFAAAHPPRAA